MNWQLFQSSFLFHNNFHKKFENKNEIKCLVDFWKFSFKQLLECIRYISSYLPKLNINLYQFLVHTFCIFFPRKFSSHYTLCQWIKFRYNTFLKDTFRSEQFFATEAPLKMIKNDFYFTLKALFVLKMFNSLSWLFGHLEKTARLERKA